MNDGEKNAVKSIFKVCGMPPEQEINLDNLLNNIGRATDAYETGDLKPRIPIGKLEFPLPECASEFLRAAHAGDLLSALREVDNEMRSLLKVDTEWTGIQVAERVRELIAETLRNHIE